MSVAATTEPTPGEPVPVPFHLAGNYRPVAEERTAFDLPVSGELPSELCGSFLRNGPNPTSVGTLVLGRRDGSRRPPRGRSGHLVPQPVGPHRQLHRRRHVRDARGRRNLAAAKANTHVVRHAGRIFALVESSFPYELTDELATVGPWDFDGRLTTAMTAHPKVCPTTGEMHFFGYGHRPPYLTYHVADAAGRLVTSRAVDVPGPTMMHDFNLTERFVVFMDLPIVFDLEAAMAGTPMPYRYDPSYGARLGVLRRDDPHGDVRWFEVEPCYVFHALNAHDAHTKLGGDVVTVDVCRIASPSAGRVGDMDSVLWRWTVDLTTGAVNEEQLDDRIGDFPRVDDRLTGMPRRPRLGHNDAEPVRHDGQRRRHRLRPRRRNVANPPVRRRAGAERGGVRPCRRHPRRPRVAARLRVRPGPRRQRPRRARPRRPAARAGRLGAPTGEGAVRLPRQLAAGGLTTLLRP